MRKVSQRIFHRIHHFILAKAFKIPKDFSRKVLCVRVWGGQPQHITKKIKKQGKPCFLRIYLTVCSLLECCANSVCARCRIARSYIYFFCRAVAFAVMIYAVGNVAIYTFVAFACVLIVCIMIHFFKLLSVSSMLFCAAR